MALEIEHTLKVGKSTKFFFLCLRTSEKSTASYERISTTSNCSNNFVKTRFIINSLFYTKIISNTLTVPAQTFDLIIHATISKRTHFSSRITLIIFLY